MALTNRVAVIGTNAAVASPGTAVTTCCQYL